MASNKPAYYQFPYVRFHGQTYPLIPITLRRLQYSVNTFALLDSGASVSVFRPEIASALHLSSKDRTSMRLGTASGGVDIHLAQLEIQIEKTSFITKIGFSKREATSFNILGRDGFFHRFSICFNEMMKTVVMVPLRSRRK